jgi:hypothetical protein
MDPHSFSKLEPDLYSLKKLNLFQHQVDADPKPWLYRPYCNKKAQICFTVFFSILAAEPKVISLSFAPSAGSQIIIISFSSLLISLKAAVIHC